MHREAAEAIDWGRKAPPTAPNKRRGKGLALMWKAPAMPGNAGSSAWIELAEDGMLTLGSAPGYRSGSVHGCRPDGCSSVRRTLRKRAPGNAGGQRATAPTEWQTVASRHHLEHRECHINAATRCPQPGSGPGGKGLGRDARRTWISSTAWWFRSKVSGRSWSKIWRSKACRKRMAKAGWAARSSGAAISCPPM